MTQHTARLLQLSFADGTDELCALAPPSHAYFGLNGGGSRPTFKLA